MRVEQVVKAAYYMCLVLNQRPSRRNVNTIIKNQLGRGFRPQDVCAALKLCATNGNHFGTTSEPVREPQNMVKSVVLGTTNKDVREPAFDLKTESITLFGINPSQGPERKRKKPKPEPDTGWLTALEAEYSAVATIPIQRLTVEQRLVFSRIVAARFGNYCRDELKNRREGVKLAGQFVRIGDSRRPQFVGMTCREYERFAGLLLEERAGKPFHTAWAVEAVIQA